MGVITRHNLCPNPSVESATTGWATQGAHPPSGIAQVTTQFYPLAGTHSLRVTWAAGIPNDFNGVFINVSTGIGTVYTASAWVKTPTGSPRTTWWISGGTGGQTTSKYDQWERIFYTFTATATTTGVQLLSTADSTAGGEVTYIDAVCVEATNDITLPYFDGDSTGASWDGTAELSTSTFTAFTTDPSLPLTVIEFDAEPVQATDFVIGVSQLDGNDLTGDTSTFDATIGTWQNVTNTTLTQTGAQGHTTAGALQMSSIAGVTDMEVKHCTDGNILTQGGIVIPGTTVQAISWVKAATVGRTCQQLAAFFDASGTLVSTTTGASVADVTTGWTQLSDNFSVPATCVRVQLHIKILAPGGAGENHFVDDTSLNTTNDGLLISNPRYVNVAALGDIITQITINRGRSDPNGDIQPGSATLYADNWTGNFDPENAMSSYNLDPEKRLVKGMLCRISALFASGGAYASQTLFVGRLDNVTLREGLQPDATLTFTDDLAVMGNTNMPMFDNSKRSGEASLSRANWLYYSIGQLASYFSVNVNASLSANLTRQLVPTYGGGSVLDELNDVASAEAGRSFVDRTGVYTLLAHTDLIVPAPLATLSDNVAVTGIEFADVQASSGTLQIVNSCRAHPYTQPSPNYPDQTYTDSASVARYGQTQFNGAIGYKAPLINSGDLFGIAQYIATRFSRPIKRYDAVSIDYMANGPAAVLLQLDIANQVVISRTLPYLGTTAPYTITSLVEGIQYTINNDVFTQTLITSPTDSAALFGGAGIFTIGVSLLNGSDVLSAF